MVASREIDSPNLPPVPDAGNPSPGQIFDPKDPLAIARRFIELRCTRKGRRILHFHRGDWRGWTGTHYRIVEQTELHRQIYELLEGGFRKAEGGKLRPFQPSRRNVEEVLHALRAVCTLDGRINMPAWLSPSPADTWRQQVADPAGRMLAFQNGLLNLDTLALEDHTPELFNAHALPFDYDPDQTAAPNWIRFLQDLWPDDAEAIEALQEWFGYILSGDTSQQKAFLLVGPKRSGKGTIARVLTQMIGQDNVAGPTLSSLTSNFGLQILLDKPLALISDARLSGRADQAIIAERILAITGEDAITIDRKHREAITTQLPSRFLVLTNELPRLTDGSGALASRFLVLETRRSWFGMEDPRLLDRLLPELPAILNWALEGLDRLNDRGRFTQPASGGELLEELKDLGSPIRAFIRERCVLEPGAWIPRKALFEAWKTWCVAEGRTFSPTAATFGRDLRAAAPEVRDAHPQIAGQRVRVYTGIRLQDRCAANEWNEQHAA